MRSVICKPGTGAFPGGGGRYVDVIHAHLVSVGQKTELVSDKKVLWEILQTYCAGASSEEEVLCVVINVSDGEFMTCLLQNLNWSTCTRRPRIVLLSTLATWAGKTFEEPIVDVLAQFTSRQPVSNAITSYTFENALYNLTKHLPSQSIEVVILPLGLVFGGGGWDLEEIFRGIWNYSGPDSAPVVVNSVKNGTNRIPIVHINDFLSTIENLSQGCPLPSPFTVMPMSEGSTCSLGDLIVEFGRLVNGTAPVISYLSENDMLELVMYSKDDNPEILRWNLDLSFAQKEDTEKKERRRGLLSSSKQIWSEYLEAHALKPLSILVAGNPKSGKTEFSSLLAAKLGTEHVTTAGAISHVLKFNFEEGDTALLLRAEIMSVVESKASEGKKPPPKKGEVEAPVATVPAAVEVTEALCASIPIDTIRQCVAALVRTSPVCLRKGFVLDLWEGGVFKSAQDVDKALESVEVKASEYQESSAESSPGEGQGLGEEGSLLPALSILKQPELLVELQCADSVIMQRLMTTLGIPEGGLAKSSKENQAMVKTMETSLSTYASGVKPVTPNIDENGETVVPDFTHSHETVIEVELSGGKVARFDSAATGSQELVQLICEKLVALRSGRIGWLPDLASAIPTSASTSAATTSATDGVNVDATTTSGTVEEDASPNTSLNAVSKRLQDRSIGDLNSAIAELNSESKKALLSQCSELQEYLGQNVMPFLVKGMILLARTKPEDPIGFMADFLINEGKALEDAARESALNHFNSVLAAAREEESKLSFSNR